MREKSGVGVGGLLIGVDAVLSFFLSFFWVGWGRSVEYKVNIRWLE